MKRSEIDAALVLWGDRLFYPKLRPSGGARQAGGYRRRLTATAVRATVRAVVQRSPEVIVKVTGGGRGIRAIRAHLSYISRRGTVPLVDERGETLTGRSSIAEAVDAWRLAGSLIPESSHRREAFNVVLSMPATADADVVREAAMDFVRRQFSDHAFLVAWHHPDADDRTERPHLHVCVRAEDRGGRRLNPRKADLAEWRDRFAEALRERGVDAIATRRAVRRELRAPMRQSEYHRSRRDGIALKRPRQKPLTNREAVTRRAIMESWSQIARALARSPDAEDRRLAGEIARFIVIRSERRAPARENPSRDPRHRLADREQSAPER
jgi:relaxase-like protein